MTEHRLCFPCGDESFVGDHNKRASEPPDWATATATTRGMMTLKVRVRGHELVALVDSGASVNVLCEAVAARLGLSPCPPTVPVRGATASGALVPLTGLCRGLDVHVLGAETVTAFRMDCHVMALADNIKDLDLILGTPWLRALGPVLWDFTELTMSCTLQGCRVTWRSQSTGRPPAGPPPLKPPFFTKPPPSLPQGPADNSSLVGLLLLQGAEIGCAIN